MSLNFLLRLWSALGETSMSVLLLDSFQRDSHKKGGWSDFNTNFESCVELSDEGELMSIWLDLVNPNSKDVPTFQHLPLFLQDMREINNSFRHLERAFMRSVPLARSWAYHCVMWWSWRSRVQLNKSSRIAGWGSRVHLIWIIRGFIACRRYGHRYKAYRSNMLRVSYSPGECLGC